MHGRGSSSRRLETPEPRGRAAGTSASRRSVSSRPGQCPRDVGRRERRRRDAVRARAVFDFRSLSLCVLEADGRPCGRATRQCATLLRPTQCLPLTGFLQRFVLSPFIAAGGATACVASRSMPTLRQTWLREGTPEPQCAFKMSMLNVVCNSH